MNLLTTLVLLAGLSMSISIGASSIGSVFGPVYSSGFINVFRSAFLAGIAALLGALLQGRNVVETVGSGMLFGEIQLIHALIILSVAAFLVIISALGSYPMPTAFTVVGAVIGCGLGFKLGVSWQVVTKIVGFWLLVPIMALAVGFVFSFILKKIHFKSKKRLNYLTLIFGLFLAYTGGANSVGLAVGPLQATKIPLTTILIIGGVAMLLGTWVLSPKIINKLSFSYSNISPKMSIAALGTAALLAQGGNFIGVPISFAEAIAASILGSGLVLGKSNISVKEAAFTTAGWVSAFFIAIGITFSIGHFFF